MLQISYAPLWETLAARGMKKVDLTAVVSSASLKKLQNHEPVSLNVLMKNSSFLHNPSHLYTKSCTQALYQNLRAELCLVDDNDTMDDWWKMNPSDSF